MCLLHDLSLLYSLSINISFGSGVRLFYVGGKMEACLGVIVRHLFVRLDRKFEE